MMFTYGYLKSAHEILESDQCKPSVQWPKIHRNTFVHKELRLMGNNEGVALG